MVVFDETDVIVLKVAFIYDKKCLFSRSTPNHLTVECIRVKGNLWYIQEKTSIIITVETDSLKAGDMIRVETITGIFINVEVGVSIEIIGIEANIV